MANLLEFKMNIDSENVDKNDEFVRVFAKIEDAFLVVNADYVFTSTKQMAGKLLPVRLFCCKLQSVRLLDELKVTLLMKLCMIFTVEGLFKRRLPEILLYDASNLEMNGMYGRVPFNWLFEILKYATTGRIAKNVPLKWLFAKFNVSNLRNRISLIEPFNALLLRSNMATFEANLLLIKPVKLLLLTLKDCK